MSPSVGASALALGAALVWGAADFSGGLAARRLRVYWLLVISHSFSMVCLLILARVLGETRPGPHILWMGFWSGIAGGVALLTFYYTLSLGEMGTTAALTGVLTAMIPIGFALSTIGAPSGRQMLGFAVAAGAIWLIAAQPSGSGRSAISGKKTLLAILSGIGFGLFLVFLKLANTNGIVWPLAASRVGSLSVAVAGGLLFSRGRLTAMPRAIGIAAANTGKALRARILKIGIGLTLLSSCCDTSGNFLFVAATRAGRLDIAAVLASLYPASTILLAVWILKERTSRRQSIGIAAALAAVVLIA
jgi:drug/metabolite transporter (DMT)-like permease